MKNIAFLLPLFLGLLFIGTDIDTDDWFLLANGRYVESFGIPHTNPFAMHEGWAFVMQQWLFALGLWKLYAAFGLWGLVGYAYVFGALVIFLYDRLVREASGGDSRFAELTLVLPISVLCGLIFFVPRPQVLSAAFLLAEVYLLERFRGTRPRWMFALLPALSALLVNLHAALWPMFLVLLLPYLCEAIFGARLARWLPYEASWRVKDITLLLVLCFGAGFLNPYGWDAMTYSSLSYGIEGLRENINECRPLSIGGSLNVPFGSFIFLLYFSICAAYVRRPVPLRHLLLAAGTGFMGLLSLRSLFLFLLFATFPLARLLAGRAFREQAWTLRRKLFCGTLVLVIVVLFFWKIMPAWYPPPSYPPQGVAAMDELGRLASAEGKAPQELAVYTGFDVGNYAEFRGFRPYIDARPEVYMTVLNHEADVFREYLEMQRGKRPYQEVLDKYPFDALVVRRDDILWHYLPLDARYTCVWDSADAGVTGREDDDMRIYQKANPEEQEASD